MSKAELVEAVQKSLGKEASAAQAERIVVAVVEGIKTGVKKTKNVQLVGFWDFQSCHTEGAHGRQSKDRRKD
jgi:DNA-binding protein HU-beta